MVENFRSGLTKLGIPQEGIDIDRQLLFLDELLRWNRKINLTSIRNQDAALEKHLLDSLAILAWQRPSGRLLDIGSGGGLPGIPLAIACRDLQVVSVDSVRKKIAFQNHIKRLLKVDNLQPSWVRLEALEKLFPTREPFTYVVARAFSAMQKLITISAPWLTEGGRLLVMKGPEGEAEVAVAEAAGYEGLFTLEQRYRYRLPLSKSVRLLYLLRRTSKP